MEPPGFWWQYSILTLSFIFACLAAAMLFPVACMDLLNESILCWNVGVEVEVQFAVLPLTVQLVWVCCARAIGAASEVMKKTAIVASFTLFVRFTIGSPRIAVFGCRKLRPANEPWQWYEFPISNLAHSNSQRSKRSNQPLTNWRSTILAALVLGHPS